MRMMKATHGVFSYIAMDKDGFITLSDMRMKIATRVYEGQRLPAEYFIRPGADVYKA